MTAADKGTGNLFDMDYQRIDPQRWNVLSSKIAIFKSAHVCKETGIVLHRLRNMASKGIVYIYLWELEAITRFLTREFDSVRDPRDVVPFIRKARSGRLCHATGIKRTRIIYSVLQDRGALRQSEIDTILSYVKTQKEDLHRELNVVYPAAKERNGRY